MLDKLYVEGYGWGTIVEVDEAQGESPLINMESYQKCLKSGSHET